MILHRSSSKKSTIEELHAAIKSGSTTCVEVVQLYINRVRAFNGVCSMLVTKDGASVPEAIGAARCLAPISFPTQTVKASDILPDLDKYRGPPIEYGRNCFQSFGATTVRYDCRHSELRQVNALATLNIRGERSVAAEILICIQPTGRCCLRCRLSANFFADCLTLLSKRLRWTLLLARIQIWKACRSTASSFPSKNSFDTRDMRTTGGGDAAYDIDFPARDHLLVELLRKKGAIIFAKAVCTEYNGRAGDLGGRHAPSKVLPSTLGYQRSTWGGNPAKSSSSALRHSVYGARWKGQSR